METGRENKLPTEKQHAIITPILSALGFTSDYIEIPTGTKNKLVESHKVYLRKQFSFCI